MKNAAIVLIVGLTFAPAAMADCAPEKLQLIVDKYSELSQAGKPLAQRGDALRAAIANCPNDAFALKLGVMGFNRLAQVTELAPGDRLAFASDSYGYLTTMNLNMPKTIETRIVRDAKGQSVVLALSDSYEVMKSAVTTLLAVEALAGRTAPTNGPPKAGDVAIPCDVYQTSMAQEAMFWIRNRQDSPGAMNMLDRLIANCTGNEYNLAETRARRARARISMINRTPERPDRAELLLGAIADIDGYKASGKTSTSTWSTFDEDDLFDLTWKALATWPGFAVAEEKWFEPAHVNKTLTKMSIAVTLDQAYARDQAEGPYISKAYIAAITPAFNRAKALPEPQQRSARLSLYEAAKKHADGVWRAEANKNVRKPPDFLYAWLDPDYKTPATTPVTTPAPKP